MSTTLTAPPDLPPADLSPKRSGRAFRNALATFLMGLALVIVLIPLGFVLFTVVQKGWSAVTTSGWFTDDIPTVRSQGPGMGPAIVGTILVTGLATLMAVPLGILGAIYLHEYGKTGRLASVLRFFADVMTGVPSIIMGLFIFTIWVVPIGINGVTAFAGALALGCLMLPIVIRSTEEMLKLVPNDLREASFAVGSSQSRTILTVVLPAALPGILSGVLLAIARAAGETAPLLFTIGAATSINWNPFKGPNTALSVQIFANAQQPFTGAQDRAWGAALTLIAMTFILLILSRIVAARFNPSRRPMTLPDSFEERAMTSPTGTDTTGVPTPEARPSPVSLPAVVATERPALDANAPRVFDVKDLAVYYGSFRAVREVNLPIRTQEITAFIGPSGCGKTTVLRCLNRMNDLIPTARVEGTLLYHGVDLYGSAVSAAEVRRRIGMVFQRPNPFPKSIYDNVAFGPKINGVRKKSELDDIVERSLRAAALWDEMKDRLKTSALGMSGGQQQRLCIARAIAVEPEVVLMDEPCSALDPIATARIEELMREMKDKYTIVIVTHNMQQAARVSDRTAFYTTEVSEQGDRRTGRLVEFDETEKIFSNPSDTRTENYVTGRFG